MIFFFEHKDILYPFSKVETDFEEGILIKKIEDLHRILSSILFFKKDYRSYFIFKKRIYKYHCIEINLYQFKNINIIQKIIDYKSNEYYLSLYGINLLREYIPTFSYTFFQKGTKELWMEYQDGISFLQYLKNYENKNIIDIEEEGNNYLSIFFQILCSLEVAQERLLFTHYDLHLENIIIKKEDKKSLSFPIYNTNYVFQNEKNSISIIDFEHSSIRYKDKIINSIQSHLFPYGYISIFYASVDLLRFILSFQYNFFSYSLQKSHFLSSIYDFHEFILRDFYGFSFLKNHETIKHSLNYHSSYFFNCLFLKKIYKTPYELLLFLKKKESILFHIFSINTLPFKIITRKPIFLNFYIPKKNHSLSHFLEFINYFNQYYTILNLKKIKEQYTLLKEYQSSFEYFRENNLIPSNLYKKSLKIYRYLHTIEQLLLLSSKYPNVTSTIKNSKLSYF